MKLLTGLLAALIGGAAGFAKVKNSAKKTRTVKRVRTKINFEDLLNEQRTFDVLTAVKILEYFQENKILGEWVIAKPTKNIADKFGIENIPDQIDTEKNFFQLVTDKTGKVLKASLVSFGEIDENLKKLLPFGTKNFVVIDRGGI